MGNKRKDWEALKNDFMSNNYANLKDFATATGINYGTVRNHCGGWMEEKVNYRDRVIDLAVSDTLERDVMTVADRNLYHVEMWDKVLDTVGKSFNSDYTLFTMDGTVRVATLERLANVIDKAQRGQRLALGMDKETKENKGLFSEFAAAINAVRSGSDSNGSEVLTETV